MKIFEPREVFGIELLYSVETALLFGFPRGKHTPCNASNCQAENDGDDADANFSGNGDSRGRQVNRMFDVECGKGYGMPDSNIREVHLLPFTVFRDIDFSHRCKIVQVFITSARCFNTLPYFTYCTLP